METDKISIRRAVLQDAELLASMGAQAFYQTFAASNTPEDMAAYLAGAFSVEKQAVELARSGSTFLIVEQDGNSIGYAHLQEGPAPACIKGYLPVEISRLYVLQNWIGKGIGSKLMRACINDARVRGGDVVWLGVWEKNARAIAFYQKWGFEIAGTHEFILGKDIQQDYLMLRKIAENGAGL